MEKTKILFVCMGNICRSPAAEGVFTKMVQQRGLSNRFEIDSAGTIGYHAGEPADARMKRHAESRGYDLTSMSRKVRVSDFTYFDMIIAMDDANYADLIEMCPIKDLYRKVVKMTGFCSTINVSSVPDPYYGGAAGFDLVLDILEDACNGLLNHLNHDGLDFQK